MSELNETQFKALAPQMQQQLYREMTNASTNVRNAARTGEQKLVEQGTRYKDLREIATVTDGDPRISLEAKAFYEELVLETVESINRLMKQVDNNNRLRREYENLAFRY